MDRAFAKIAFTPAVRATQARQGSGHAYEKFLAPDAERSDRLGDTEMEFIRARDGFYQATVSETGWPYVQFRGGPAGFLKVIDERTIADADFRGNRQYLSVGNLSGNDRISLILMDYLNRRRLKIWGRAKTVDIADDPHFVGELHDTHYRARPERAVVIRVEAYDWNCPQHIPQRTTLEELQQHIAPLHEKITRLEEENTRLKSVNGVSGDPKVVAGAE